MILRPRQKLFVERSLTALDQHGNTLGVAPTGAGKTVMLSAVAGGLLQGGGKACILAHRDELTSQNETKFHKVNPAVSTSVVDANAKDWAGQATFAMVQTLCRPQTLESMPTLDLLVVDEAHHITAGSYRRIIEKAQTLNTNVRIYGVTATPSRGDKKALREVFSNVADQIRIGELIASGHLVSPRTFVIDAGATGELQNVRKLADDFDMKAVEAVMNKSPVTDAVIRHWREKAGDRKTVVFCSTLKHAADVTTAFQAAGIAAVLVHGELSTADRRAALACFENGQAQVVVNVAVLTEGWDYPPTSCVVLLRPSNSFCLRATHAGKSTMFQMISPDIRAKEKAAKRPNHRKTLRCYSNRKEVMLITSAIPSSPIKRRVSTMNCNEHSPFNSTNSTGRCQGMNPKSKVFFEYEIEKEAICSFIGKNPKTILAG